MNSGVVFWLVWFLTVKVAMQTLIRLNNEVAQTTKPRLSGGAVCLWCESKQTNHRILVGVIL